MELSNSEPKPLDDLGIVILSYGEGPAARLVEHLVRTGVDPSTIVVVHNPSEDRAMAPPMPHGAGVINRASNSGYGHGMNEGIEFHRSSGRSFVALVTHDVFINGSDLFALRDHLAADPSIGLIAPAMRDLASGDLMSVGGSMSRTARVRHLDGATMRGVTDVDWVDGSVVVMRSDGPSVPDQFFLYFEDVALGWYVRRGGLRVCCDTDRAIETTPGAGSRRELFRYLSWRNRLGFARTELPVYVVVSAACELVVVAAARTLQALRRSDPAIARRVARLYMAALVDGLTLRLGTVRPEIQELVRSLDGAP